MTLSLLLQRACSDSPTDAAEAVDSDVDRHGDRDKTEEIIIWDESAGYTVK
jgi:hypothetical protein